MQHPHLRRNTGAVPDGDGRQHLILRGAGGDELAATDVANLGPELAVAAGDDVRPIGWQRLTSLVPAARQHLQRDALI